MWSHIHKRRRILKTSGEKRNPTCYWHCIIRKMTRSHTLSSKLAGSRQKDTKYWLQTSWWLRYASTSKSVWNSDLTLSRSHRMDEECTHPGEDWSLWKWSWPYLAEISEPFRLLMDPLDQYIMELSIKSLFRETEERVLASSDLILILFWQAKESECLSKLQPIQW